MPSWTLLSPLLRQSVVAALAAGEVARTAKYFPILNLDAATVVDGLAMSASARLFPDSFGHNRMLSQGEGTESSSRRPASL